MDVIIVSKTQMSNACCIGGVLANGRFVRLLNEQGYNQDVDTVMKIGDVYTIIFQEKRDKKPPHVEDILVSQMHHKSTFSSINKMVEHLKEVLKVKIWRGSTEIVFNGKIQWTSSGSGFISESGGIPANSVGFWIPDKDLSRNDYEGKVRFSYPPIQKSITIEGLGEVSGKKLWRNIAFVGFQSPADVIPAGTLVRLSLARWWSPDEGEKRCFLQLSGWYGIPESKKGSKNQNKNEDIDDLPF